MCDVTRLIPLDGSSVDERLLQDGQHLQVGGDHQPRRLLGEAAGPDDVFFVELEPHLTLVLDKKIK